MDSTQYSQADFASLEGKDMMERANVFWEFLTDLRERHHLQYRRVSLSGSAGISTVEA